MVTFEALQQGKETLAVVGLGYVGLPLAVALSRHMKVLGFDISAQRVKELQDGHDRTREVDDGKLQAADVRYTCDPAELKQAAVIIVAHHAKAGVEALFGIGVPGGDRRNLGDTRIVVNPRSGNAGAGIPVADDARDAAVHQTLGDGNGGAWVGLIVFRLQLEGYRLAADGRMLLVDIVNRQLRAVFQILADTRGRAGERACQADNDGFAGRGPRGG